MIFPTLVLILASVVSAHKYYGVSPQKFSAINHAPTFQQDMQCTEPVTNCPAGFSLQGNMCVNEITMNSDLQCLTGQLQGSMCVLSAPTIPTCEPGYILRNGVCTRGLTEEKIPYCPDTFEDIGNGCMKMVPAKVIEICTTGVQEGNGCVLTETNSPIVTSSCPAGFEKEDGTCCKVETYDCTPPGAKLLECHEDSKAPECIAHFRELSKKGYYGNYFKGGKKTMSVPYMIPHPQPMPQRIPIPIALPQEHVVIQKTCQKKIVKPLIYDSYCAVGELTGGICVIKSFFPLTPKCTVGGDPNNCFTKLTSKYEYTCPEGYYMSGFTCRAEEQVPCFPTCPSGFTLANQDCLKHLPASPFCTKGVLGGDNLCHDKEFAPPTTTWCVTCVGTNCHPIGCNGPINYM